MHEYIVIFLNYILYYNYILIFILIYLYNIDFISIQTIRKLASNISLRFRNQSA